MATALLRPFWLKATSDVHKNDLCCFSRSFSSLLVMEQRGGLDIETCKLKHVARSFLDNEANSVIMVIMVRMINNIIQSGSSQSHVVALCIWVTYLLLFQHSCTLFLRLSVMAQLKVLTEASHFFFNDGVIINFVTQKGRQFKINPYVTVREFCFSTF